ncbi:unnamed protein product [Adineta ricciae]|uniref:Uncharacterized protein n=1 Tax=Adineta ricciae TaxID=249248 RepID=A0A813VN60_ADIRI|nr:unnamed protein product [Adineta ricciae]
MHLLGEIANQTWLRLEDLLQDLELDRDKERRAFIEDTQEFFRKRLAIYEQERNELENHVKNLAEQMFQLFDELQLPRISIDRQKLTLMAQRKLINEKIDELKELILERDKELIQLRESITIKMKFIGNIHINVDEIKSTNDAHSILSDLNNQLSKLKQEIQHLLDQIQSLNPESTSQQSTHVKSYLSTSNELSWLTTHQPLNGQVLRTKLSSEYEILISKLREEVVRLRAELEQNEPSPPKDLREELADLRLRKRYLSLLKDFPHKLTSRSTLDEIRQTYERLTASLRAEARKKLTSLWDQLDVPENQRIVPKTKENQDDYLAMNDEIHRLEAYVESIRTILVKIQKREWYKKEMVEFEKHAGDPARLRGNSTQLLKEEKFRKDLSREFPKLTDDLHRMVAEWEESSEKKLIYGGEPYLETMNKEKLGVDFELLHLRLLTKCQLLVQPNEKDVSVMTNSIQTPPKTPPMPRTPPPSTQKTTSRIPTMNFVNSNRKVNKYT